MGRDVALDQIEKLGVEFIEESKRYGSASSLFWVYVGSSIGVFGISYGAFLSNLGLNFWQAVTIGILGVAVSSFFCGIVSLSGKRGNAPTMILSRSLFGVRGNVVPNVISGTMSIGWESIQAVVASLASATVLARFGISFGSQTPLVALAVIMTGVVVIGIFGHGMLVGAMRALIPLSVVATLGYIVIGFEHFDWAAMQQAPPGNVQAMIGAFVLMLAGSGITLCRVSADYSRYLPRTESSVATILWPMLGMILPLGGLIMFGAALAASNPALGQGVANDPIGALTNILPVWYLLPFAGIVIVTTIFACTMDIYSASLSLLATGLPVKRYQAILLLGLVTIAASAYVLIAGKGFFTQFQAILITLGTPVAAWAGMMSMDIMLRRKDYCDADLRSRSGRYGDIRWRSLLLLALASLLGWGFVTNNMVGWLGWQGYLLGPIGGREGLWGQSNLGILVALLVGAIGYGIMGLQQIRHQESLSIEKT